jgi:DNA-binding MarR family transcriptional regulator
MSTKRCPDAVDAILEQWRRERPDLDTRPMGPIGRLKRCAALIERRLESNFAGFGLTLWEFDMLATLRRSGPPYRLTPTALFSALMVTSGTMTHRLNRLAERGLIERVPNPDDARSQLVQLSDAGRVLIDRVLPAHLATEAAMLNALSAAGLEQLDKQLSCLMRALERHGGAS